MNVKKINHFLQDVAAHNNREWFQEHKAEYLAAKSDFEEGISKAIAHYAGFDDEIAHLQVKDCTYRFYRDIRFSSDKSPYKRHFGAYICAHGKKSLRGGLLYSYRARTLSFGSRRLLFANEYPYLVPQRDNEQHR